MNIENNFTVLSNNEMEDINGGLGPVTWCLIGLGAFMLVSGGISAFNGYQEAKWENK